MDYVEVASPTDLVAVVGGPGSGKSTVAEHLVKHGFTFYSISEVRRIAGLTCSVDPNDFEAMRRFTENFYAVRGRGVFAEYALLNIASRTLPSVVLEGLRYPESISVTRAFCAVRGWRVLCLGLNVSAATAATRIASRARKRDPQTSEAINEYAVSVGRNTDRALQFCDVVIENDGTASDLLMQIDDVIRRELAMRAPA